ncbi:Bromodomain-containing protein [Ceratobasidium sp. AG-I]|nr:Bromodomain-containing protein [Ceratobasidium sp. AG-I]
MALPLTFLYPLSVQPGGFSFDARSVKIARHSNCSQCDCPGWHPPEGCAVVIANGSVEAQLALDEAEESTEVTEEGFWRMCACGDGIEDHGNGADVGPDEIERRARVAIRIDEILDDKGMLSDFISPLTDADVLSLRKQMVPFDESNSRNSEDISPPSSPASKRSSSSSALSDPPPKLRKNTLPDLAYSSDEDEVPLASRPSAHSHPHLSPTIPVPPRAPSSTDSGFDLDMEMDLDIEPEPEPEPDLQTRYRSHSIAGLGGSTKGGKSAAAPPGVHKTVAAMGPAALPVDAPMKVEVEPVNTAVPVDERQIARLATGAAVDVAAFTEPIVVKPKPALLQEQRGTIRFTVVSNDGSPTSLILLTGLKTLFQKQLPKMPREYIARLVYDRSSQGMAIVKRGLRVVGGITFRPFPQRGFAEIVFFAISSVHQVAGFGAHLMNKFKMYIREQIPSIGHFLTYADNFAIGYFKKQGFTKEITLPRSQWMGYIKDYEGGTIMQCSLIPKIDYLCVQELLAKQKQAILDKIRAKSHAHLVHPGLQQFKSGHGGPVDYRLVPGLKESGWTPEMDEIIRMPARGPHHSTMEAVLKEMRAHPAAWPFQKPVNTDEVKDYLDVVKKPMDFGMMEFKLENNAYAVIDEFVEDAKLVLENCKLYNPESTVYHKTALRMEKGLQDILKSVGM